MTDSGGPKGLFAELRRRNVYRVGATYLVAAFVVLQVADLAGGAFSLPSWFEPMMWVIAAIGFPIALVLGWALELGPDGVKRTPDAASDAAGPSSRPRGASTALWLGLMVAGVAGGWVLMGMGSAGVSDRSIAVLPFEVSGGEEGEQFGRGLEDGLLTRLTNVQALTVTSRTSTRGYRGSDKTIPGIASELGVAWIVEGAVSLAGDRVRVNASLIDARTDDRHWARDYDREVTLDNIFDIQSDLAQEIARSLEAELSPVERERLTDRPTDDLEAYRLYVQGLADLERRTGPAIRRAAGYFEGALQRDSLFVEALARLADARIQLSAFAYDRSDTLPESAYNAALGAVGLGPDLAEARAALGHVLNIHRRDGPGALAELTRATELNPSYAPAFIWLSILETQRAHFERALEAIERAVQLDPRSPSNQNVMGLQEWIVAGHDSTALTHFRRSRELEAGLPLPYINEGLLRSTLGQHASAVDLLERGLELSSEGTFNWGFAMGVLGAVHARAGDEGAAGEVLARLRDRGDFPFSEAMTLAALGREDEALDALETMEWTAYLMWDLQAYPALDPLRDDARFQELVRDVMLMWGFGPDGEPAG